MMCVTRERIFERLSQLLPSQFETVLFRAGVPTEHLSSGLASQATRAIEVIRYFEQQGELQTLAQTIEDVETCTSAVAATPDPTVPSCPNCGQKKFAYASSHGKLIAETLKAIPSLLKAGLDPLSIGIAIATSSAGRGYLSIPKAFYNSVVLDIPETPLLVCQHCRYPVIMCPHCKRYLVLTNSPGTGALIECQGCHGRFGHCECDVDTDQWLTEQNRELERQARAAAYIAPSIEDEEMTALQWFERGLCVLDVDEKIRSYTEAIRIDPGFVNALFNRALTRERNGDLDGAIEDFSKVIRLKPNEANYYDCRGTCYLSKQDLKSALKDLNEAIRLDRNFGRAFYNRGVVLRAQGDEKSSRSDFYWAAKLGFRL
jgi:hypothetical protein